MRLPGRRSSAAPDTQDAPHTAAEGAAPGGAAPSQGVAPGGTAAPAKVKRPLYPRLLRLRHIRPSAWQRAVLGEGALALAVLLVLADVASAWTLLVLPLAVAVVVKAHDVLAGLLAGPSSPDRAGPRG